MAIRRVKMAIRRNVIALVSKYRKFRMSLNTIPASV